MSSDLFSGGDAAHRFETLYTSPKVVARRKRALEILALRNVDDGEVSGRVEDEGLGHEGLRFVAVTPNYRKKVYRGQEG